MAGLQQHVDVALVNQLAARLETGRHKHKCCVRSHVLLLQLPRRQF